MAAGPIYPISSIPDTSGRVVPNTHSNGVRYLHGMGVEASLGADAKWHLVFPSPWPQPTGTLTLHLIHTATATANDVQVNVQWYPAGRDENWDQTVGGGTMADEGTFSHTYVTQDSDSINLMRVYLDDSTYLGLYQNSQSERYIFIDVVFKTSGWTMAAVTTWIAYLVWEEGTPD